MSENITIYHNPKCTKSREALELLEKNKSYRIKVIHYLKDHISKKELTEIIQLLKIKPFDLIRKNEEDFKSKYKDRSLSDEEWIEIMVENPKLIERPIVIKNNLAIIGRPPSLVLTI